MNTPEFKRQIATLMNEYQSSNSSVVSLNLELKFDRPVQKVVVKSYLTLGDIARDLRTAGLRCKVNGARTKVLIQKGDCDAERVRSFRNIFNTNRIGISTSFLARGNTSYE